MHTRTKWALLTQSWPSVSKELTGGLSFIALSSFSLSGQRTWSARHILSTEYNALYTLGTDKYLLPRDWYFGKHCSLSGSYLSFFFYSPLNAILNGTRGFQGYPKLQIPLTKELGIKPRESAGQRSTPGERWVSCPHRLLNFHHVL